MIKQGYRPKMSREERAKQFMPFAALKGYEEALRRVERISERSYDSKNEVIFDEREDKNDQRGDFE